MKDITKRGTTVGVPAKREEIIQVLNQAFSTDLIELEEFEERIDEAEQAHTVEALEALVADLPVEQLQPAARNAAAGTGKEQRVTCIMSDKRVSSKTLASGRVFIKNIMGNLRLDFRNVELPPGETVVRLKAIMSNLQVTVPPGLTVELDCREVMSSVQEDELLDRVRKSSDSVIRISGSLIMSNLVVDVR